MMMVSVRLRWTGRSTWLSTRPRPTPTMAETGQPTTWATPMERVVSLSVCLSSTCVCLLCSIGVCLTPSKNVVLLSVYACKSVSLSYTRLLLRFCSLTLISLSLLSDPVLALSLLSNPVLSLSPVPNPALSLYSLTLLSHSLSLSGP